MTALQRVAYVVAGTGFAGAERVAFSLAHLAKKRGLTLLVEAAPQTRQGLAEFGLSTPALETELSTWVEAARERVDQFRPDLVHVHLPSPSMFGAGLRVAGKFSTLVTFHLLPERRWPRDRLTRLPSRLQVCATLLLRRNVSASVVSRVDLSRLRHWVPSSKLNCVINGIPLSLLETEGAAVWPGEGLRLLTVGRLVPEKAQVRLLRALGQQCVVQHPWHLVVVGDGSEMAGLRKVASELGLERRVTWAGAVPAGPWYRAAELVLAPSRYESSGLVPLEAAASGVPVLLSRIPPHLEAFAEAPESFLAADEANWASQLDALFREPSHLTRIQATQAAIGTRASSAAMWQRYQDLYASLL